MLILVFAVEIGKMVQHPLSVQSNQAICYIHRMTQIRSEGL